MKKQEYLQSCIRHVDRPRIQLQNKQISFVEVNSKKNTVVCVKRNNNDEQPFTVRTEEPLQKTQCIGYYEVHIKNLRDNEIWLGLCRKDCSMKKPPGMSKWSVGLHCTGKVMYDKQRMPELSDFQKGDTIGCGIIYDSSEVFFTKNGVMQSPVIKITQCFGDYFPQASLHNQNDTLEFNFGENPYKFDLNSYIVKLRSRRCKHIVDTYTVDVNDMHSLVEDYLYYSGFMETLTKFQKIKKSKDPNYLLVDPAGKDVINMDKTDRMEEQHKVEEEENNEMIECDLMSPQPKRQRIMSESNQVSNILLMFSPRKDSYDERISRLMNRKDSLLSNDMEMSVKMDVEEKVPEVPAKPYGQTTRLFLSTDRVAILKLVREMKIEAATDLIMKTIPKLFIACPLLSYYLDAHIYLRMIREGKRYEAIDYARMKKLNRFEYELFPKYCPDKGHVIKVKFSEMISSILAKPTENRSLLSVQQFHSFSQIINNEIMRSIGLFDKSKLQIVLGQIKCIEERFDREGLNGDRIVMGNSHL